MLGLFRRAAPAPRLDLTPRIPLGFVRDYPDGPLLPYSWGPDEEKSLLLIAPTRAGKFTTHIAPCLLDFYDGGSVVVNDPKGEAAAVTGPFRSRFSKVLCINPFRVLVDQCPWMAPARFNPLAALDPKNPDFTSEIAVIIESLILKDSESYFFEGARRILTGLAEFLVEQEPQNATLPNLNLLLNKNETDFVELALRMQQSGCELARNVGNIYSRKLKDLSEGEVSQLDTARTQLSNFLAPRAIRDTLSASDFTLEEVKDGGCTVYIVMPLDEGQIYFRLTRLVYASALRAMMKPPPRRNLIIMDEIANSLGEIGMPQIVRAANFGGGNGLRLELVAQNWPQMIATFGKEGAASLLTACGAVMAYRPNNDPVTVQMLMERAGSETVYYTEGTGQEQWNPQTGRYEPVQGQRRTGYVEKPRLTVDGLYSLPTDEQILIQEGEPGFIRSWRYPYFDSNQWPHLVGRSSKNFASWRG